MADSFRAVRRAAVLSDVHELREDPDYAKSTGRTVTVPEGRRTVAFPIRVQSERETELQLSSSDAGRARRGGFRGPSPPGGTTSRGVPDDMHDRGAECTRHGFLMAEAHE
ncbi:hypothetical protein ACIBI3_02940 [Actinomadura luteofluorescens]|uniref:hypothetical protein n=1 Tax=Actinomadura luteofluorescens TaxID=46163 RepID=UPI00346CE2D3